MPGNNATGLRHIANILMGGNPGRVIQALSSGANTITPPTGADFVIIELDELDTTRVNFQASGTGGVSLSRLVPTIVGLVTSHNTTFTLDSVSATCNVWLTYGRRH